MKNEGRSERIVVLMTAEEVQAIEDYAIAHRLLRGRSEAIRRLIELGLRAQEAAVDERVPQR